MSAESFYEDEWKHKTIGDDVKKIGGGESQPGDFPLPQYVTKIEFAIVEGRPKNKLLDIYTLQIGNNRMS